MQTAKGLARRNIVAEVVSGSKTKDSSVASCSFFLFPAKGLAGRLLLVGRLIVAETDPGSELKEFVLEYLPRIFVPNEGTRWATLTRGATCCRRDRLWLGTKELKPTSAFKNPELVGSQRD